MNTLPIDIIKDICIENRHWFYMPESEIGTYNIDAEQVNKIYKQLDVSKGSDNDIRDAKKIIKKLIDTIQYINFNQYMIQLKKIASELIEEMKKDYEIIYFICQDSRKKSNTWVLMLFIDEMLKRNFFTEFSHINNKIYVSSSASDVYKNCKSLDKNILIVYFDDMSYSGTQISRSLPNKKDINKNINIYVCLGFISKIALENIDKECDINIFPSTKIFESLYTVFVQQNNTDEIEEYERLYNKMIFKADNKTDYNSNFNKAFQTYDNQILVYFDHKIADGISTIQKFIYYGSYPLLDDTDICITIPLIKKCEVSNITSLSIRYPDKNMCKENIVDIADDMTCPKTFYKQFEYKYKGIELQSYTKVIMRHNKITRRDISLTTTYDSLIDCIKEMQKTEYLEIKSDYLKL
jgi:hypothetical protein